jgi:hypothetical protein
MATIAITTTAIINAAITTTANTRISRVTARARVATTPRVTSTECAGKRR